MLLKITKQQKPYDGYNINYKYKHLLIAVFYTLRTVAVL